MKTCMSNLNHSGRLATGLFAAALLLASASSALADVHYVDVNSTNATPPYTNWTTPPQTSRTPSMPPLPATRSW